MGKVEQDVGKVQLDIAKAIKTYDDYDVKIVDTGLIIDKEYNGQALSVQGSGLLWLAGFGTLNNSADGYVDVLMDGDTRFKLKVRSIMTNTIIGGCYFAKEIMFLSSEWYLHTYAHMLKTNEISGNKEGITYGKNSETTGAYVDDNAYAYKGYYTVKPLPFKNSLEVNLRNLDDASFVIAYTLDE